MKCLQTAGRAGPRQQGDPVPDSRETWIQTAGRPGSGPDEGRLLLTVGRETAQPEVDYLTELKAPQPNPSQALTRL